MGGGASRAAGARHAKRDATIGSIARLEALANVAAQNNAELPIESDEEFMKHGCRLGYSSVRAARFAL